MKTVSITVSGKVQGVWFRKFTCDKAKMMGLAGTVQNLPNGDVFICATGTTEQVTALEEWCWQGSPESKVIDVVSEESELNSFSDFQIIE
ncbi:MAG: acylphosphatase [Flavobacteriales bacterium]|nr:acylphosphatase [Flavobacteriales bacterium]